MIVNMKITGILSRFFCQTVKRFHQQKDRQNFSLFFRNYLETYVKKDKRVLKQAYTKYMEFLTLHPDEKKKSHPDSQTIRMFVDHLLASSRGSGAASTYSRFRKVVILAHREHIIPMNPCSGIRCPSGDDSLVKDILSEQEIRKLLLAHPEKERQDVRRAFLFCLYTGIRFCDVITLRYSDFDLPNGFLTFEQSKTKGRSRHSRVHIPLRKDLIELIGKQQDNGLVFPLPSHPTCLKELRRWTEAAGITKHITWHCARHTFATNILKNGADIRVVADLLGHSGLRYVERYTRAIDEQKFKAVNTLPPLF